MMFHNKQLSGIITSSTEPWCTVDSEEWRWEQLKIFNLKGLIKALKTLNLPWNILILPACLSFLFFVGTFIWFDKSYVSFDYSVKCEHHGS